MIQRLIARLLGRFAEVRRLRDMDRRLHTEELAHKHSISIWKAEREAASLKLRDTEQALSVMTEARLNVDRSHEFLRGEVEALKEAQIREVDGLKRTIDAFAPSAIGRTVFGLAPEPKPLAEQPQAIGSKTRRTTQAEALAHFYAEAEKRVKAGSPLHPNPNNDTPAEQLAILAQ